MLDAATPREVWVEYEARKRAMRESAWQDGAEYARALERIADELGIGIDARLLSSTQRSEQTLAIARWKGERCAS